MADYAKAAFDLKARLNAKTKKRLDLNAFFESVKTCIAKEVKEANAELAREKAPLIDLQQASVGEPTIDLVCGKATCTISQDRSAPSISAVITGETGEKTITYLVIFDQTPLQARRLSQTPGSEEIVAAPALAAAFVEALIAGAP